MRHDQKRRTLFAQPVNEVEEHVDFVRTEGGRWFVKDDEASIERKCSQDLDHLLLGHGQVADLPLRIDWQVPAKAPCQFMRGPVDVPPVQPPSSAIRVLMDEENILPNGEVRDETKLLQNDSDAGLCRIPCITKGDRGPIPLERAA